METIDIKIEEHIPYGVRLDQFLVGEIPDVSRAQIQKWIKDGHVLVNSSTVKPRYEPKVGDVISVNQPPVEPASIQAIDLDLDVLFEDKDILVVNKPAGLVVHPAAGHANDTLVNALMSHCGDDLSGIGGVARPGIVHRLDMDTSGCLIVAKNDKVHLSLSEQFAARSVKKIYKALAIGDIQEGASRFVDAPIGRHRTHRKQMTTYSEGHSSAKNAMTTFYCEKSSGMCVLFQVELHTGRTHQIRVHLKHIGMPLLGDLTYGKRQNQQWNKTGYPNPDRQMLHAWKLKLLHPIENKLMEFEAPLPKDFQSLINELF